jgi:hypothetical protein
MMSSLNFLKLGVIWSVSIEKNISLIRFEINQVEQLLQSYDLLLKKCRITEPDLIEITAAASVIHSFYNGVENIFLTIAKRIDEQLPQGIQWHRDLLKQMSSKVPNRENQEYNFQDKFRALVGKTKHSIQHYVENGFSNLPRGTFIQLEKQAKEYVLRNLKQAAVTRRSLVNKMKYFEEDTGLKLTLENFVRYHGLSLHDFYGGRTGNRTFNGMKVEAGLLEPFDWENDDYLTKRIPALLSLNSRRLLQFLLSYLDGVARPQTEEEWLMLNMFYYTFYRS